MDGFVRGVLFFTFMGLGFAGLYYLVEAGPSFTVLSAGFYYGLLVMFAKNNLFDKRESK